MSLILQIFCTLISSATLAFSIPNESLLLGSPVFAMISLIPLYFTYRHISTYRQAGLLFALHAFAVHLMSSYWLGNFKEYALLTLLSAGVGTALIAFFCGLFFFLPYSKNFRTRKLISLSGSKNVNSPAFRVLWFTLVFTSWEWVKSSGFLGYPWGTVSSAMYKWGVLIQIADITGRYGITFLVTLFNCILGEGIVLVKEVTKSEAPQFRIFSYFCSIVLYFMLFLASFSYGLFRINQNRTAQKQLNVILVQQNADPWKQNSDNDTIKTSISLTENKLSDAKARGVQADLIIWSEGALKYSMPGAYNHYNHFPLGNPLVPFIKSTNVPFIIGGPVKDSNKYGPAIFNSALLFDQEGNYRGYYPKNHLVPFAEVVPFMEYPKFAQFMKKNFGFSGGWAAGDQYVSFDVKGTKLENNTKPARKIISLKETYEQQIERQKEKPVVRISTPICYDDSFPDIMAPLAKNGTEVFISITDDSWSSTKSAEYQHFANAVYLPIEYRTTMIRSCNSGYSCVISPLGTVIADMPLFEEKATFVMVPVYAPVKTVYLKLGNWLPYSCVIFILFYLGYSFYSLKKPDNPDSERNLLPHKKNKKSKKK